MWRYYGLSPFPDWERELRKQAKAVREGRSQELGYFAEWVLHNFELCEWREWTPEERKEYELEETPFSDEYLASVAVGGVVGLLERYFGIDRGALEDERRMLLVYAQWCSDQANLIEQGAK